MRFVDEVSIHIESGKGGDGAVAFRREKFVPLGGPDGGDGGRGGNVVLVTTTRRSSLLELRGHAIWRAKDGERGGGRQRTGKSADDVELMVPAGTRVFDDETGELLADLTEDGLRFVAARGGAPGKGNWHFKSSTNRSPTESTPGEPGVERRLRLELMLMADVGLLGFPNAGKSTLISRISAARPKVADYPFTTLVPNLGVVDRGIEGNFVVADIPGLIRGAADGAGLGHQFLRHLQRTRTLLHLVSLGPDELDPPEERYSAIRDELMRYDPDLATRPERIVLTKVDLVDESEIAAARDAILARATGRARPKVHSISAATGAGIKELVDHTALDVQRLREAALADGPSVVQPPGVGPNA
jgi:GTPase